MFDDQHLPFKRQVLFARQLQFVYILYIIYITYVIYIIYYVYYVIYIYIIYTIYIYIYISINRRIELDLLKSKHQTQRPLLYSNQHVKRIPLSN